MDDMNVFDKSFQVESIFQMGWLLYSFDSLDLTVLVAVIGNGVGSKVALRFKYIITAKYELDKDERNKWMALHIETVEENRKSVARGLSRLNSHSSIDFPMGIWMRLLSEFREV